MIGIDEKLCGSHDRSTITFLRILSYDLLRPVNSILKIQNFLEWCQNNSTTISLRFTLTHLELKPMTYDSIKFWFPLLPRKYILKKDQGPSKNNNLYFKQKK